MFFRKLAFKLKLTKKVSISLFMIFMLSSCTHMHVPADSTLTKGIKKAFSEVTKNDANLYSAMLENKEKMEAKEHLRLEMLSKESGTAFATQLYTKNWESIQKELHVKKDILKKQQNNVNIRLNVIHDRLKLLAEKKQIDSDTLKATKNLLKKAAKEQNLWFARHEFFRKSIKSVADIAVAEEADSDFDVGGALKEARNEILKSEITVVGDNGVVSEDKNTIGKIIKDDNQKFTELINNNAGNIFSPNSAPGIKIIILGLAVDLAEIELKRIKLESGYLKGLVNILKPNKDVNADKVQEIIDFIEEAEITIQDRVKEGHFAETDKVLQTINALRSNRALKTAMRDAFKAIGIYSIAMNEDGLPLELQLVMLDHQYSIQLSAINAQEHEALISRGLQGLDAYHEGGIKPETIANFIRAVQAVGLGVIGAGVL